MGGLVARYGLTFIENEAYIAGDFSSFFVEAAAPANTTYTATHPYLPALGLVNRNPFLVPLMDKTRGLITLDTLT
jgi:hypothetical protein